MPCRFVRELRFLIAGALLGSAGCLRFSPFQTDLDDEQRDQTRKNLERLAGTPAPGGPLRLAFVSDTHRAHEELSALVDWVTARDDLSLVLHGGDMTDFGSRQEYLWVHEVLERLRVPAFVAPGNHDLLTSGASLYDEMFGPRNVAFDWGGYRFLLFDTNTIEGGREGLPLAWLRAQLGAMPADMGAIVFTHHPPDSRPHISRDEEATYRQIQREGGVVLNLHGHIHSRYYVRQDGPVTYVNARTGLEGHFVLVELDRGAVVVRPCNLSDGCAAPTSAELVAPDERWPP
jgi:3',5'-cyclic-AMP phosphodiesterase